MSFFKEFREFALKGNVMDMAVGVIIGGAFGKIVSSLVNDILMPPIGALIGNTDFSSLRLDISKVRDLSSKATHVVTDAIGSGTAESVPAEPIWWNYGAFIQQCVDFAILAFCVFLMVKMMNKLMKKKQEAAPAPVPEPSKEELLLTEIRINRSMNQIRNIDCKDREHHHSQRREQHRQYLTDGRHGKDIGTDSRKVHTGPPDRIAEIVQRRIDFDLVIIKNQSGEIGEHQHRQDVGGQQSRNPIIDDPGEKHIQPQQSPQKRYESHQHRFRMRKFDPHPIDDIQIGNGKKKEIEIAKEKTPTVVSHPHPGKEIGQKNNTDDPLQQQVVSRIMPRVPQENLPRNGHEQRCSGQEGQDIEYLERQRLKVGSLRLHHIRFSFYFPLPVKINAIRFNMHFQDIFFGERFGPFNFLVYICTRFQSNGEIAQLVRAHDS